MRKAIVALARGFIAENESLRRSSMEPAGALALFVDTFRLVAGIVVIGAAEERDILHPVWAPLGARRRFAEELSVRRPVEALRWRDLTRLLRALQSGDPVVGLAAIAVGNDGGLLDGRGALEQARITDEVLSAAIRTLAGGHAGKAESGGARTTRWSELARGLGQAYEELLHLAPTVRDGTFDLVDPASGPASRHDAGAYYTPQALVDHMLDAVLEPALAPVIGPGSAVLDPACGSGHFLLAVAERRMATVGRRDACAAVCGVDIDPIAVDLCRAMLWLLRGEAGLPLTTFDGQIRRADALLADWSALFPAVIDAGGFDVIVGNPPYLNQLETGTAANRERLERLKSRFGSSKGAYTDVATLFLLLGVDLLRPGGRMALLHPLSLLASKDSTVARARLATACSITSIWVTTEHIFAAASVFVCAIAFLKNGGLPEPGGDRCAPGSRSVARSHGNGFQAAAALDLRMDDLTKAATWGHLVADLLGVPLVVLKGDATVSDLATTTADFRDQFYGLVGTIVEAAQGPGSEVDEHQLPRLIVTGSVDPAACLWGERACTFAGTTWQRPRVDLRRLQGSKLQAWAEARLVPKLVIATQTRVIEAFADPDGTALNTVPTITLIPHRPEDLWRLLAVMLAPPVSAWALARYVGTALSTDAIKLSASQVGQIPLPSRADAWEQAALLVQRASGLTEAGGRAEALHAAGALMCDAYGVDREPVLAWWTGRLRAGPAQPARPT